MNNYTIKEEDCFVYKILKKKSTTKNDLCQIFQCYEKEQMLPFLKSYVDYARTKPYEASNYYKNDNVLVYAILLLQNCFNHSYRSDEVFLTENEKDIIRSYTNYFKQRKVRKEKS